jgi:hypothetical protein
MMTNDERQITPQHDNLKVTDYPHPPATSP